MKMSLGLSLKSLRITMASLFVFSMLATSLLASEYAVLSNGFRIHAERHEEEGAVVRLYNGESVTEIPTRLIQAFEPVLDFPHLQAEIPSLEASKSVNSIPAPDPRILLREAATRSGLPPSFVESVARVESGIRSDAVSPKGALGIMQLMPETAKRLSADPLDPAQNVDAGARLLRELLIKYDGDVVKALSAYNAGENAVARYRGMPPYPETQNYVDQVIRNYIKAGGR